MRTLSKTLSMGLGLVLAASLISGTALAQDAEAPASDAAAARLPNAFDGTARQASPAPVQAAPVAEAPDVTRGREALMVVIADAQDGALDYSAFSEDVAGRLRPVEDDLTAAIQGFGALGDITYIGRQNGADLFEVNFENLKTQWVIGFDADDHIAVLLFREAPAETTPAPAPGS
jgi:streptogramin lyase